MYNSTIAWLLEESNPAIRYRTQTEILGQSVNVSKVKEWIFSKLPVNWFDTKGLWYVYHITALAECGLSKNDVPIEYLNQAIDTFHPFEPMRIGIHSIVESFSALGYGNDERLSQVWDFLYKYKTDNGRMILS